MRYFRIQTNRISIKKLLINFRSNIDANEALISPRPPQGQSTTFYYAIICVNPEGKNIHVVKKFKNCKEMTIQEYESEKASIKHFWSVL
jgi:hypothetical protein